MEQIMNELESRANQLKPLIGAKITKVLMAPAVEKFELDSFGFEASTLSGHVFRVWFDTDPEGNGMGFAFVEGGA